MFVVLLVTTFTKIYFQAASETFTNMKIVIQATF